MTKWVGVSCAVDDCDRSAVSRGWCRRHYQRWQKRGSATYERPDVAARIERRTQRTATCWLWSGGRDLLGYGVINVEGKTRRVTRVAWEITYGPIPEGLSVLHSCDNPPCVRLDHLMLGTQRANIQDMLAKGRRPKGKAA